ncbi:MAG: CdaR family protein [Treponema sp.]
MSIKKLIEKLSENMLAKIICAVLALGIYVFHRISVLDKRSLTVPLTAVSNGAMTNVTELPRFVKVYVRTKTENAAAVSAAKIKASVNLDYYSGPGQYSVPVDIALSPDIMLVDPLEIIVKPESVPVRLDEKIVAYIPVEPALAGEPSHGYEIKNVFVSPSAVKVMGASSVVKGLKQVFTSKVNVKGASIDFSAAVKLDNIVPIVQVFPESDFAVTVDIEPIPMEKTFSNVKIDVLHLKDGLKIEKELPNVSFTAAGVMPVLEKYELLPDAVAVDCAGIEEAGAYELPVIFFLPNGIKVEKKSVETLSVEVSKAEGNPEADGAEAEAGGVEPEGGDA